RDWLIGSRHDLHSKQLSSAKDFTESSDQSQGDRKSKSHSKTVKERINRCILCRKCFRTAKDDTVYYDQRNIKSQRRINRWHISFQQELHNRYQRSDDYNVARDSGSVRYNIS